MTSFQLRSHLDALNISVSDFAEIASVSPRTVYRWISDGAKVPRVAVLAMEGILAARAPCPEDAHARPD